MAFSLYDMTVPAFLQTLGGINGMMERGIVHFRENTIDPEEIIEARLLPGMQPFRFQIQSALFHSMGAIRALKRGAMNPQGDRPPLDYAGLQGLVQGARGALREMAAEEINALEGTEITFDMGDTPQRLPAERFVLAISLPNLHFHAANAYSILRTKGVPLEKRDYIGALRARGGKAQEARSQSEY